MKLDNKCYVLKSNIAEELDETVSYDVQTGEGTIRSGWKGTESYFNVQQGYIGSDKKPIFITESDILGEVQVLMYDDENNYLGYKSVYANDSNVCELDIDTAKILVNFQISQNYNKNRLRIWFYCGYEVNAIYSKLEKVLKHENSQMFFRESLNGNIVLSGKDFQYVYSANLEQNMLFAFYSNSVLKAKNIFNKTDCKFDTYKCIANLKLSPLDKYTDILNKYEDEYDIIKLAPKITQLTLTKRLALQVYIKGANDITTIANGAYWQDDVNEVVDDNNLLTQKYYFAKNYDFKEVHLSGLPAAVNGSFTQLANVNSWKSAAYSKNEKKTQYYCDIHFEKVYSANDSVSGDDAVHLMVDGGRKFSNDTSMHVADISGTGGSYSGVVLVDLYKIQLRFSYTADFTEPVTVMYESQYFYTIDDANNGFKMKNGTGLYKMRYYSSPEFSSFYLGENVIEYEIFTRIIADIDKITVGGAEQALYDIPYDDFTYTRANYKKCIGISAPDYWRFYQTEALSDEPTKYGQDDYGKYFSSNFAALITLNNKPIPISRNSWANTSIWFAYTDLYWLQDYESKYRVEFPLKDAYHIADVISVMLKKINPEIKHEATSAYSNFLYGTGEISLGQYALYIAPKSNVLKGNYDQAAQKAEITFKQLMEMLRDCFRCYWFIDNQNRFRIEHISYFLNGFSYSSPSIGLDLTSKFDKFNKKKALYCQEELEYSKSELDSRYEFAWSDDSTDLFGNNSIDVNSQYVQKDKTENVNPDLFSADIDFMLFAPDKFSSDGFALIIANKETKKVPIVKYDYFKDSDYIYAYSASVQNWYASWLYLIKYYMYDMPAYNIDCSGIYELNAPTLQGLKKSMSHSVQYSDFNDPEIIELVKTTIGNGLIDEVSINLSTRLITEKLIYEPS